MDEAEWDIIVRMKGTNEILLKVERMEEIDGAWLIRAIRHAAGCRGALTDPDGYDLLTGESPLVKGEYRFRPLLPSKGGCLKPVHWLAGVIGPFETVVSRSLMQMLRLHSCSPGLWQTLVTWLRPSYTASIDVDSTTGHTPGRAATLSTLPNGECPAFSSLLLADFA